MWRTGIPRRPVSGLGHLTLVAWCACGTAASPRTEAPPSAATATSDPAGEGSTGDPATQPRPCSAPEHRQFDFWIGTWDVLKPDGTVGGRNVIEPILGGCVLRESFVADKDDVTYEGTSYNIYEAGTGRWHQTWVDTAGNLLQLDGGLEGNRMVLRGETAGPKGTLRHEIAWQPMHDGRVEQRWRASKDGGKTWEDVFVGIYVRAK